MREFNYTITDEIGIHARPAGIIAKKAKEFAATTTITKAVFKVVYYAYNPKKTVVKLIQA